jgi:hypothetical protein
MRNPVAWLVGLVLATGLVLVRRRSRPLTTAIPGIAVLAIAATFLAPAQSGVHRWIDLGPLHINVAALLLPPAVVALAFGIRTRLGIAFAVAIGALLVLQPDASQATSFGVAVIISLARSAVPVMPRLVAIGATVLVAAASWMRRDPLQPVPEAEGIFPLAFGVSPVLAAAAALALAAASLAPLALRTAAGAVHRTAALALSGYFVSAAICPAFGAFPVPLVGLGMSFPVGYWLGIALLCANAATRDAEAPRG